jgi:hypothetical protein
VYQIQHCYHDLGWYNSFDKEGWSKCLPNYFVAGMYRSCESLYCLQIGKCCSMTDVRYTGQVQYGDETTEGENCGTKLMDPGWTKFELDKTDAFITGFYRGQDHDVTNGLKQVSYCEFVRGY